LQQAILPLLLTAAALLAARPAAAGPAPQVTVPFQSVILSPLPGQALQGNVAITGSNNLPRFQSADISFSYTGDPTGTWFLIQRSSVSVSNGVLAQWDTTTITDSNYNLRMTIHLSNGEQTVVEVQGLRVRNYSPVETDTPTPLPPSATPAPGQIIEEPPSATPAPTFTPLPPTPTPLPTNPAELSSRQIGASLGIGAASAAGLLLLLGAYATIRRITQR
jgi:hypothetical protein